MIKNLTKQLRILTGIVMLFLLGTQLNAVENISKNIEMRNIESLTKTQVRVIEEHSIFVFKSKNKNAETMYIFCDPLCSRVQTDIVKAIETGYNVNVLYFPKGNTSSEDIILKIASISEEDRMKLFAKFILIFKPSNSKIYDYRKDISVFFIEYIPKNIIDIEDGDEYLKEIDIIIDLLGIKVCPTIYIK